MNPAVSPWQYHLAFGVSVVDHWQSTQTEAESDHEMGLPFPFGGKACGGGFCPIQILDERSNQKDDCPFGSLFWTLTRERGDW